MKITQVRAHVLRSPLAQPFAFSQGWVGSRGATLGFTSAMPMA